MTQFLAAEALSQTSSLLFDARGDQFAIMSSKGTDDVTSETRQNKPHFLVGQLWPRGATLDQRGRSKCKPTTTRRTTQRLRLEQQDQQLRRNAHARSACWQAKTGAESNPIPSAIHTVSGSSSSSMTASSGPTSRWRNNPRRLLPRPDAHGTRLADKIVDVTVNTQQQFFRSSTVQVEQ